MISQLYSNELRHLADYLDTFTEHRGISLSEHYVFVGEDAERVFIKLLDDGTWCAEFGDEHD